MNIADCVVDGQKSPTRKKARKSVGRRVSFAASLENIRTFERVRLHCSLEQNARNARQNISPCVPSLLRCQLLMDADWVTPPGGSTKGGIMALPKA
eukprot:6058844-Pyramimonas_sp.AAC.1